MFLVRVSADPAPSLSKLQGDVEKPLLEDV